MGSTRSLLITLLVLGLIAMAGAAAMVFVVNAGSSEAPVLRDADVETPVATDGAPGGGSIRATTPLDENLYHDFYLPDFQLTDQDGRAIDQSVLDGRYTVVDFFFTTCPLACPGMNSQMQRVQGETQGSKIRLLSISVSGDYDSPAVLTAYAEKMAADPDRWRFLTGDPKYVARLVYEGLKFEVAPDDSFEIKLPGGGTMFNVQHPTKLLLIGPDHHVVAMASYQSPEDVTALIELAKRKAGG
ncbi:MAG: SCO family protein [Phycisphaerales bacterium]